MMTLLSIDEYNSMTAIIRHQDKEKVDKYDMAQDLINNDKGFRRGITLLEELGSDGGRIGADALADLGLMHLHGYRGKLAQSAGKAYSYLNISTTYGSSKGRHAKSFMQRYGIGVPQNVTSSIELEQIAATDGYLQSLMTLGFNYMFGYNGFPYDSDMSLHFYRLGAQEAINIIERNFFGDYHFFQKLSYESDCISEHLNSRAARDAETVDYWNFQAKRKNARALYEIGKMFQFGLYGCRRDMATATDYFNRAASAGYIEAQGELGRLRSIGHGIHIDPLQALELLQPAADAEDATAMATLGILLAKGTFSSEDPMMAVKYLRRAAAAGSADAEYELGQIDLRDGRTETAIQHFLNSYKIGHMKAAVALAHMYENGIGVTRSWKDAALLYRIACESGPWVDESVRESMRELRSGRPHIAVLMNLQAALEGYDIAHYNAAWLLLRGGRQAWGRTGSLYVANHRHEIAMSLLLKAIASTNSASLAGASCFLLGELYHYGHGVNRNLTVAASYYEAAIEKGHLYSMVRLAKLLRNGAGVRQDLEKAELLLRRSYGRMLVDTGSGGLGAVTKRLVLGSRILQMRYNRQR